MGRLPTFCLEWVSQPPRSPSGPCPHSPPCTVPIIGVETLDPIQRSEIALDVNQGCQSRKTSMSCPPQEQGAGKTHLNRCLYLRKVFTLLPLSLLILWLPTLLASFLHRGNWGFKRFRCRCSKSHREEENETRFSPSPSNPYVPLSSSYCALTRCQAGCWGLGIP